MKQLGRKSLALFTALVMAASLCILPAAAEGTAIATVNGTPYSSLQELVGALDGQAGAFTIVLEQNVVLPTVLVVGEDQQITLDLNGKYIDTIRNESTQKSPYAIENYGTVVALDSVGGGYIRARGAFNNSGTLTIQSGKYIACDENGGAAIWNEGNVYIEGGTFTTEFVGTSGDKYGVGCLNNSGYAHITKGIFTDVNARTYAIISTNEIEIDPARDEDVQVSGKHGGLGVDSGTAIVNGGSYTSEDYYGLYVSNDGKGLDPISAAVTVNGGSFDGKTVSVWVGSDYNDPVNSTIEINGGTFLKPLNAQDVSREGAIQVKGGTFSSDVSAYVADGYSCIEKEGNYVINGPVAAIGATKYATLAKAMEAVQDNDVLTILEGTYDEPLIINRGVQNVTICGVGEGKTVLTGGLIMTTDQPIPTNPARDIDGLTIKDIAFQGKGIKFEAWWENGSLANITIQNNRFSNIQDGENSAIHFNLSAQLAVENISVLDNVIDGVGTGNTSPSGINISAAKGDVRIENNTVRNTNHSSIQLFNQSAGTLLIQNNRLENWDRDQVGGGRAFRFENLSEDITSAVIRNNCMVPAENFSGEDADIFKISGTAPANLDATRNYWGTATPDFATLVTGGTVKTDPWYKAETMRDQDLSNYVPSGSSSSSSSTPPKPTVDTETKTEGDVKTETVTETVKNKDGSTTTNVTETATNAATGEKTETKATETVAKDGSVTKEEVKTTTAADGTKTEEKNVAISDKATGTETTAQVVTDGTGKTVATARTEARPEAAVKDGAATAAVDQKAAEKLVEQAKAAAETAKDADRVETAVVLTAQVPKEETVTAVSVEVPRAAVESLAKETAAAVVVSTPIADVTLPNSALEALAGQKGETVAVKAEKTEDGGVKVAVTVGDQALEMVSGGLKASLPVEEAAPGTVAVLVHADGTEEIIRKSVVTDGTAVVPLDGSATIKLVDNGKDFPDTADHWAGEAVEFVTARGLFQGVSDDSFAPGAEMTRGMLVTVLNRLENEPAAAGTPAFPDVTDGAYYAGAVAWAAETGIVTGTGAGFDPEAPITRQTLATILYRYLGTQGADLSLRGDLSAYADGDAVDGWAQEAVAYAVGAGLMTGKDGGVLDPAGTATRAEVAIVLQRMVEGMA